MKRSISRGASPSLRQPARPARPIAPIAPPLRTLALALALAACGGAAKPTGPAKPAELTTAEAVMEASLAAQGGRERIGKVKAIRQTGQLLIPQMGIKGTMTVVSSPPHNSVTTIELSGLGKIAQGFSGDVAWEVNPVTGARIITGAERTQLLREAMFNGDLIWKQLYPKAELAGVVEFVGVPSYKVVLTPPEGDAQTRYFAKDTLLPVGVQMTAESQMGKQPIEMAVSDWRDVNGIKYAHKIKRAEGPQSLELVLEKVEHDPPLDPATFALPPEIQALQKK